MSASLYDSYGNRKYLNERERNSFFKAASNTDAATSTFCATLGLTGARISEVLSLVPARVDASDNTIVFRTLKQRSRIIYRAIPVPGNLASALLAYAAQNTGQIWPWCRTTAWARVKAVMKSADIDSSLCKPKALRHAFGVASGQKGVPLNITQRWLGHARIETTAIYAQAVGEEERRLASLMWNEMCLPPSFCLSEGDG